MYLVGLFNMTVTCIFVNDVLNPLGTNLRNGWMVERWVVNLSEIYVPAYNHHPLLCIIADTHKSRELHQCCMSGTYAMSLCPWFLVSAIWLCKQHLSTIVSYSWRLRIWTISIIYYKNAFKQYLFFHPWLILLLYLDLIQTHSALYLMIPISLFWWPASTNSTIICIQSNNNID